MNEMQVFQNSEFGELGVLEVNGKPYFPATACARALGYANTKDAIIRHCKGVVKHDLPTNGGIQTLNFIPEGDLYRLITHSKLPAAERFEKWVFDEVLPSIRQTGGYGSQAAMMDGLLDKLVQITANLTQTVTILATVMGQVNSKAAPPQPKTAPLAPAGSLKLEAFPDEIVDEVDRMLALMREQQTLNFSQIARFCTMNGYTISSPSVKRYFDRHFSED